eukprot:gene5790-11078_t
MSETSSVPVYDSLQNSRFDFQIQNVIASLIHSLKQEILIKVEDVQNQEDGNSCGLFAIAYAVTLCFADDPRQIHFDKSQMRNHLMKCLCKHEMTKFPQLTTSRMPHHGKLLSFTVNCTCRLPIDADDVWKVEKCPLCGGRYHKKCNTGKKRIKIIRNGIKRWFCSKCTDQCNICATYEIKDKDALPSTITILSEK